jgi:A/G-specific adenine glycosylase
LHLGLPAIDAWQTLPALQHSFTHFKLELVPLLGRVKRFPEATGETGLQFLPIHALETAALPAPIKRLLQEAASRV